MKQNYIKNLLLFFSLFIFHQTSSLQKGRRACSSAPRFFKRNVSSQSFKLLQAINLFKERSGFTLTLANYNKQEKEEHNHGFEYEILKAYELELRGNKIVAFNFCYGTQKHAIDFVTEKRECCECKSGRWPAKVSGKKSRKLKTQLRQQNTMVKKLNKQLAKDDAQYTHIVLSKKTIPTDWTKFLAQLGIAFEIG